MKKVCLLLASIMLTTTPTFADDDDDDKFKSVSHLSSAQEVQDSPVISDGKARGRIKFARDFSSAQIRLRFKKLEGKFAALHLHCNVAGANGPIIVDLSGSDNITIAENRVFGTITNKDIAADDPCMNVIGRPINNIASLAAAVNGGYIYWNLHTTVFPAGELRGQAPALKKDD